MVKTQWRMGEEQNFSIAPRIKSDRREATTLVVRCGTCKTDKHRMKENGSSHSSDSFFCGHFNCSKSMFLCLLSLPETRCFKEKPHTTPSSPTNTSHMNIIAMGTNKGSPFCSPVYGQLSQNSHARSSILSLLLDLLNSCRVRYAFYKIMIPKYTEGGHVQQLLMNITVIFAFCK